MVETPTSIFPLKSDAKNWTVNRRFTGSTRLTQTLSYKERKKEFCFVALFQTLSGIYMVVNRRPHNIFFLRVHNLVIPEPVS